MTAYSPVMPYLAVSDAAAAIDFYKRALGAGEKARMPSEVPGKLMHAEIVVNGAVIMLSDEFPGHGVAAPAPGHPAHISIMVRFRDHEQVDSTYDRAVAAGAIGQMPPTDMFWGDRFATIADPFGHRWLLTAQLPSQE